MSSKQCVHIAYIYLHALELIVKLILTITELLTQISLPNSTLQSLQFSSSFVNSEKHKFLSTFIYCYKQH